LDRNRDQRDSEIQEVSDGESPPSCTFAGEIDEWEPIKNGPQNWDVQSSEDSVASRTSYAGKVGTWTRVNDVQEEKRWMLACWMMCLLTAWLLSGLIAFFITGNVWLLTGLGAIALPVKRIFDHYFHELRR
jgi:hypothetical protein